MAADAQAQPGARLLTQTIARLHERLKNFMQIVRTNAAAGIANA